jgi:hypothetical protein
VAKLCKAIEEYVLRNKSDVIPMNIGKRAKLYKDASKKKLAKIHPEKNINGFK